LITIRYLYCLMFSRFICAEHKPFWNIPSVFNSGDDTVLLTAFNSRVENLSPAMGRGIDSRKRVWNCVAKLRMLEGRYDNPMPTWFLAPISRLKLPTRIFKRHGMIFLYKLLWTRKKSVQSYNIEPHIKGAQLWLFWSLWSLWG